MADPAQPELFLKQLMPPFRQAQGSERSRRATKVAPVFDRQLRQSKTGVTRPSGLADEYAESSRAATNKKITATHADGGDNQRHNRLQAAPPRLLQIKGRAQDELSRVDDAIRVDRAIRVGADGLETAAFRDVAHVQLERGRHFAGKQFDLIAND